MLSRAMSYFFIYNVYELNPAPLFFALIYMTFTLIYPTTPSLCNTHQSSLFSVFQQPRSRRHSTASQENEKIEEKMAHDMLEILQTMNLWPRSRSVWGIMDKHFRLTWAPGDLELPSSAAMVRFWVFNKQQFKNCSSRFKALDKIFKD